MNKTLRKYILNTIGLAIFATITIITLIIARGNRVDIRTGQIIETGTIRINSKPEDVTVFLNEQEKKLKEKRLETIDPGQYSLRIQKEGYSNWTGVVEVNAGFITDLSVTLFPVEQNLVKASQTNIDRAYFDRSRNNIIYTVIDHPTGSEVGIWKLALTESFLQQLSSNQTAQKITNITSDISFVTRGDYRVIVSSDATQMILANGDYSRAYLLSTSNYNEPSSSNRINFDFPVDSAEFLTSNTLLLKSGNLLVEYDLTNKTSQLLYYHPQQAPLFDIENNVAYWLNPTRDQIYTRAQGLTAPIKLENIALPKDIATLDVVESGKRIILGSTESVTFIESNISYLRTFTAQRYVSSSPNGRYLITENVNDGRLNFIENVRSEVYDEVSHNITTSELSRNDIADGNVQWSFDASFFIFPIGNGDLVALDNQGKNLTTLVQNEDNRMSKQTFGLNNSSSALLIVLQDGLEEDQKYNLYRLNFSITQ